MSRNYNFGDAGSNMDASSFNKYLRNIESNSEERVDLGNLDYLLLEVGVSYGRRRRAISSCTF